MNREYLLQVLPPYKGAKQLIAGSQRVNDIINEILTAHDLFAPDYDRIAGYFAGGSVRDICDRLVNFCRSSIVYRIETEKLQTVKSPAAILAQHTGDCKHYASFIGGVLDALNRQGAKIKWRYRFASYAPNNREPEHIFVVVENNGTEIWADPTPGAEKVKPFWQTDKKVKPRNMALMRVSGIDNQQQAANVGFIVNDILDSVDIAENPKLYFSIQLLLKYGILDADAKLHDDLLGSLQYKVSPDEFTAIQDALQYIKNSGEALGNIFSTIWRGVKKVTLAAPRAAFLSLVAINAFGYATKLKHSVYNTDGTYTTFKDKIKDLWQNKLGGDWTKLENTINNGAGHKAILGVAPAAVPAWVAVASAVIAAVMPLVNAFLKTKQQQTGIDYSVDPTTGLPYNPANVQQAGGSSIMAWIQSNPMIVLAAVGAGVFLMNKKK